jgi:choline dehydrogenase-like flavoprotein
MGFKDVKNFNSPEIPVDVCATLDVAIDEKLRRVSSYHAFLPANLALERHEHLKICTKAVGTCIEFDEGVAVGVVFESSDRSIPGTFYARARREIVICSGAIGSPQLLLLRLDLSFVSFRVSQISNSVALDPKSIWMNKIFRR